MKGDDDRTERLGFECTECIVFGNALGAELVMSYANRPEGWNVFPVAYPVDLNGDGVDEYVAQIIDGYWCGTAGCSTWVLSEDGGTWHMLLAEPLTADGVDVLPSRTNGYRDIELYAHSFGETCFLLYRWSGTAYAGGDMRCVTD
ncbi:MAG: hypothetical protein R3F55_17995 [Alphaproteobacteria bacterium]